MKSIALLSAVLVAGVTALSGCANSPKKQDTRSNAVPPVASASPEAEPLHPQTLPGMPPPTDPKNVYAAAGPGMLSEQVKGDRELVYVPNSDSDDVMVIDPKTYKIIDRFPAGDEPQHVVPSYDMRTLYVNSDLPIPGGSLTPIDPRTGKHGPSIPIQDPYNLYFTPDGKAAVVMAEYYRRLDFYDPKTWRLQQQVVVPECEGLNHMDFSADGRTALISCEWANRVVVMDVASRKITRQFTLHKDGGGGPQDTRLSPDGSTFYVADMNSNGVWLFNGDATKQLGFIPTGRGTHGVYFSRDGKRVFITNRLAGSVTVLDAATRRKITEWDIPGGSPDMGALNADGTVFWLSGRYNGEVYAMSTVDGKILARIKVGAGPHGLLVWPQPGRYSLGHTGNIR